MCDLSKSTSGNMEEENAAVRAQYQWWLSDAKGKRDLQIQRALFLQHCCDSGEKSNIDPLDKFHRFMVFLERLAALRTAKSPPKAGLDCDVVAVKKVMEIGSRNRSGLHRLQYASAEKEHDLLLKQWREWELESYLPAPSLEWEDIDRVGQSKLLLRALEQESRRGSRRGKRSISVSSILLTTHHLHHSSTQQHEEEILSFEEEQQLDGRLVDLPLMQPPTPLSDNTYSSVFTSDHKMVVDQSAHTEGVQKQVSPTAVAVMSSALESEAVLHSPAVPLETLPHQPVPEQIPVPPSFVPPNFDISDYANWVPAMEPLFYSYWPKGEDEKRMAELFGDNCDETMTHLDVPPDNAWGIEEVGWAHVKCKSEVFAGRDDLSFLRLLGLLVAMPDFRKKYKISTHFGRCIHSRCVLGLDYELGARPLDLIFIWDYYNSSPVEKDF